jgi:hypothetical protein
MKRILAVVLMLFCAQVFAQSAFVIPFDQAKRFSSQVRPVPAYVNARVLAAAVAETITPPANSRFVVFAANCNFYVKVGGSAAATPAADITDGSASELNPSAYYLNPASPSISVITPDSSCILTAAFYTGPVN